MNEGLSVFLHLDEEKRDENEALIQRIDKLLLTVGMKYSGFQNIYIPVDTRERDSTVYRACRILEETEWLKGIFAYCKIITQLNTCPADKILTEAMSAPSPDKLCYYEQYYQNTGKMAHGIVVDEEKQIRDGYISYLLAEKYGIWPDVDVYEAFSEQPLYKTVAGRHVALSEGKWIVKNDKRYRWIYTLRNPVVPGDVLLADTKEGSGFMCVDAIDYVTGREFCGEYKKIRKHTNMSVEP